MLRVTSRLGYNDTIAQSVRTSSFRVRAKHVICRPRSSVPQKRTRPGDTQCTERWGKQTYKESERDINTKQMKKTAHLCGSSTGTCVRRAYGQPPSRAILSLWTPSTAATPEQTSHRHIITRKQQKTTHRLRSSVSTRVWRACNCQLPPRTIHVLRTLKAYSSISSLLRRYLVESSIAHACSLVCSARRGGCVLWTLVRFGSSRAERSGRALLMKQGKKVTEMMI